MSRQQTRNSTTHSASKTVVKIATRHPTPAFKLRLRFIRQIYD